MRIFVALLCGALFGAGLLVSGMTNPQKVQDFLDIWAIGNGGWDPSLALVMAGGLVAALPFFRLARTRKHALCGGKIMFPPRREIDRPLAIGAVLFGTGWGLAGYCPGPAISGLALGRVETMFFVLAMMGGMLAYRVFQNLHSRNSA